MLVGQKKANNMLTSHLALGKYSVVILPELACKSVWTQDIQMSAEFN